MAGNDRMAFERQFGGQSRGLHANQAVGGETATDLEGKKILGQRVSSALPFKRRGSVQGNGFQFAPNEAPSVRFTLLCRQSAEPRQLISATRRRIFRMDRCSHGLHF